MNIWQRRALLALPVLVALGTGSVLARPALPDGMTEFVGTEFNGVWSGVAKKLSGDSCANFGSIKFTISGARIYSDGFSQGAFYGSGISKIFGVIHRNKSVELVLADANGKGRVSVAKGKFSNLVLELTDNGRCSYAYELSK